MSWAEFKERVDEILAQQGLHGWDFVDKIQASFSIEHCDTVKVKQTNEGLVITGGVDTWSEEGE